MSEKVTPKELKSKLLINRHEPDCLKNAESALSKVPWQTVEQVQPARLRLLGRRKSVRGDGDEASRTQNTTRVATLNLSLRE